MVWVILEVVGKSMKSAAKKLREEYRVIEAKCHRSGSRK